MSLVCVCFLKPLIFHKNFRDMKTSQCLGAFDNRESLAFAITPSVASGRFSHTCINTIRPHLSI